MSAEHRLHEFMAWLEGSVLGHLMRESGVWTYACVNLIHILGVASLFGAILVLDLRLLGLWRKVDLRAMSEPVVSVAVAGFIVAAMSGVCLLATKATEYVGNPFLYIKFPAVAVGVVNALVLNFSPAWQARGRRELSQRENRQLAWMGGTSLACWLTAIGAGRMIAYW